MDLPEYIRQIMFAQLEWKRELTIGVFYHDDPDEFNRLMADFKMNKAVRRKAFMSQKFNMVLDDEHIQVVESDTDKVKDGVAIRNLGEAGELAGKTGYVCTIELNQVPATEYALKQLRRQYNLYDYEEILLNREAKLLEEKMARARERDLFNRALDVFRALDDDDIAVLRAVAEPTLQKSILSDSSFATLQHGEVIIHVDSPDKVVETDVDPTNFTLTELGMEVVKFVTGIYSVPDDGPETEPETDEGPAQSQTED